MNRVSKYYFSRTVIPILFLCLLLFWPPVPGFAAPDRDTDFAPVAGFSWDLSLYGGCEWMVSERFGTRCTLGTSLFLPLFIAEESFYLSGDFGALFFPSPKAEGFTFGILAGVPAVSGVWYADEDTGDRAFGLMCSFGADALLCWNFESGHQLRLLLGAGYPIFYEQGVLETRDIHFPLDLWPIARAELRFPFR